MSAEIAYLLRLGVPSDKEFVITPVTVEDTPAKFTSQLSDDNPTRKTFAAYNNSHADSGEILWGSDDVVTAGMPIPKGVLVNLPIAVDLDVYFCNSLQGSGELGDLRVLEGA